jgi:predicted phage tail protein
MSRPSVIPESLVIPLLKEWESGKNAEECVVWLKANHNIDSNVRAVNRRIKNIKDIEIQARRDAISKGAAERALDYISIMNDDIMKLDKITKKLLDTDDENKLMLAKQLLEIKLKNIDKQMNLTGMDKPDKATEEEDALLESLLSKLPKAN